jgi:ABC-type transporter Mla maintaining outer membrane lipid asymmetry ATPase subunit MlaF
MDRKLHDTIQELKVFKKKQNAEIDDLIVSLQNQATIGAGTIAKPSVEVLRVKDKVTILNTGKYLCDKGTISKINTRTNVASIVLASGQTTSRLLKNLKKRN